MEENNLDNYFKEKLDGHTEEPSPAVWEGIDSKLPKAGFGWNKRYLILLLLLISIGGATFFGYRFYQMDSRVAQLEEKIKTNDGESISEIGENANAVSDQKTQNASTTQKNEAAEISSEESQKAEEVESTQEKNIVRNQADQVSAKASSAVNQQSNRSTPDTEQVVSVNSTFQSTLNTGLLQDVDESASEVNTSMPDETLPSSSTQNPLSSESLSRQNSMASVSSAPLVFNPTLLSSLTPSAMASPAFTARERKVDYFEEPSQDWFLFIYGMANYTHRRVVAQDEGAEAIPNRLDKAENGLITPGAGLQLSRELGKHFRFSIGMEYNQWIQEGSYSAEVVFSDVEVLINTATGFEQFDFDGSVESSFGSTEYNSTSGENPFGIGFETLSPDVEPVGFNVQTRQQINYLSVPISLEYIYKAYPFIFAVGGGFSVNHILNSNVEYIREAGAPPVDFSPSEKVEGTYLAFQAGIAVEYGISERMSIRLNPSYRGWMNPIFENEEIRTLPFGVAVRAGIIFRLSE